MPRGSQEGDNVIVRAKAGAVVQQTHSLNVQRNDRFDLPYKALSDIVLGILRFPVIQMTAVFIIKGYLIQNHVDV